MWKDFVEWFFNDFMFEFGEAVWGAFDIVKCVFGFLIELAIAIITLPFWIVPFIFWFFTKRKDGANNG